MTMTKVLRAIRIWWATARFDFWLDIYGVRRQRRRELRRELGANLADAASHVGLGRALVGVGSTRRLALESSRDDLRRPAWSAGLSAALITAALLLVLFVALALSYAEGVIDSGVRQPVSSGLFPFVGSSVEVHSQGEAGLSASMAPGPVPFMAALVAFLAVARPWRVFTSRAACDGEGVASA